MPRGYRNAEPPPHGDNRRYLKMRCRCQPCREAHTRHQTRWRMVGKPTTVEATVPARKIRALSALGWSHPELASHLGVTASRVGEVARQKYPRVSVKTARKVDALYRRLCMTPAPDGFAATRAKSAAAAKGYAPPLAWDDIDDPAASPDMGASSVGADPIEWKWLIDGGEDPIRAAERLGVGVAAISRTARRRGLHDIARLADAARPSRRAAA